MSYLKIKNGVNVQPSSVATGEAGDLRVDSSASNALKYHDGSGEKTVLLEGAVTAAMIDSGAATDGQVLTADGSGGASFATRVPTTRQFVVGTAQTSSGAKNTASQGPLATNNPTVSFTATRSGTFRIAGVVPVTNSTVGAQSTAAIVATSGSPTVVQYIMPTYEQYASGYVVTLTPQTIVTCTAGVSYTFEFQISVSSGTVASYISAQSSGIVLTAEELT